MHAPGHTPGHTAWVHLPTKTLLASDAVAGMQPAVMEGGQLLSMQVGLLPEGVASAPAQVPPTAQRLLAGEEYEVSPMRACMHARKHAACEAQAGGDVDACVCALVACLMCPAPIHRPHLPTHPPPHPLTHPPTRPQSVYAYHGDTKFTREQALAFAERLAAAAGAAGAAGAADEL